MELEKVEEVKINGSLLPYRPNKPNELKGIAGPIFPLPVFFKDTIPRQAAIIQIFCLQENEQTIQGDNLFFDSELNQGVYIHSYKDMLNDTG